MSVEIKYTLTHEKYIKDKNYTKSFLRGQCDVYGVVMKFSFSIPFAGFQVDFGS